MARTTYEESLRKAAVILASLDRKQASAILKAIEPEAVQALISQIHELGEIMPEEREAAFAEFATRLNRGVNPRGGADVARALLQEVVSDPKKRAVMEKESRQAFSAILEVSDVDLAAILSKEQPSVAAMIVGFMPPKKTAGILSHLPVEVRGQIIARLANSRTSDPEIVARIEKIFVEKVVSVIHTSSGEKGNALGGPKYVADIFQHVEQSVEEEMLKSIQDEAPERADEVRDLLFTFEDIVRLRDQDIQKVLRQVSLDKLVIALKGVSGPTQEKLTRNLSKHAQESMEEEMGLLGKVKLSEVEAEQRSIVTIIRGLEAAGELSLRSDGKEETYV